MKVPSELAIQIISASVAHFNMITFEWYGEIREDINNLRQKYCGTTKLDSI